MILLIIGMNLFFHPHALLCSHSFIQQMFPYAFTQWTCYPLYIATAMARLSLMSRNQYERLYLVQRIEVRRISGMARLFWLMLIVCSGQKLCRSHCMGHHFLYYAHGFPVVHTKKRRCRGEGTVYEANWPSAVGVNLVFLLQLVAYI